MIPRMWMHSLLLLGLLWGGPVFGQLSHGDPAIRVVGSDQVNVRSEPRVGEETFVAQVARGTLLKRLEKRGDWYQVQLSDGRSVWIFARYAEEVIARDLLEVLPREVNVRGNASTAGRVVATAKQGDMLPMVRERNGWYFVGMPDGKQGWVREDMVARRPLSVPELPPVAPEVKPEPSVQPEVPSPEGLYQQGKDLLVENRVDEAIAAFKQAAAARPSDGALHLELAKLLRQQGQEDEALGHFRQAQRSGRDEAKFFVDEILKARADAASEKPPAVDQPQVAAVAAEEEEKAEGWWPWDQTALVLPAAAIGAVVFLLILGLMFYRRRQRLRPEKPAYRRRKQDAGFDSVLKYAVEKRPLLRAIEEAERKRLELDETLQQRLSVFEGQDGKLPTGISSEALLKKVEDLRHVILNQEERAQIYSDLIVLQNEKLTALDEEIEALKKLIQIDYREGGAGGKAGSGKG